MSGEYLGDFVGDETLTVVFDTFDANGQSVTISGLATTDIEIYKGSSVTQRSSDSGYTLIDTDGTDIDGATGIHGFTVDLSDNTDAGFYAAQSEFYIVVNAILIGSPQQTVRFIAARFSIDNRGLLRPTTATRTLDVATTGEAGVDLGNVTGTLTQANVGWVDSNSRVDVGLWLGTAVTTSSTTSKPEIDVFSVSDDSTAADNLESQYDTTGLTGDTFPATQAQVGGLATGAGGISQTSESVTITTGTETSASSPIPTYLDTAQLDEVYHQIDDVAGTTDFYYQFDIGVTGQATEILWDGYVQSNGDSADVYGWNWVSSSWDQVGSITGSNSITRIEKAFIFTVSMTGTAADDGKVRCRFASTTATSIRTDRILCEYTSVIEDSLVLHSGIAQGGTSNTITLDTGASATDDFYNHAKVIILTGTGDEQERLIVDYVGSTRVATIAPPWITVPDSTSAFEVEPALAHAETGWATIKVGIAAAGTSTTITLDSSASSTDDFYNNELIHIDAGTGEGQVRVITDYVGSTKVATVHTAWTTNPDTTSEYIIEEGHPYIDQLVSDNATPAEVNAECDTALTDFFTSSAQLVDDIWDEVLTGATHNVASSSGRRLRQLEAGVVLASGTLDAATSSSVDLETGVASEVDDFHTNDVIVISGGTGQGQSRVISSYTGSGSVAGISPDWVTNPDNTSTYNIISGSVHTSTQRNGYTNSSIHIAASGISGTVPYNNGTEDNPLDDGTLSDAVTLDAVLGFNHYTLSKGSSITLASSYTSHIFNGIGGTVALNGQVTSFCTFKSANVSGIQTGTGRNFFESVRLNGPSTITDAAMTMCSINGTITLSDTGDYSLKDCYATSEASVPVFDFTSTGNTELLLLSWDGPLQLSNVGNTGTDSVVITGKGEITINSSCTGGTIKISGDFIVTDNSAGSTVTYDDNTSNIAGIQTDTTAIEADTQDIQSRLPAALVSGRMDVNVSAVNDSNASAVRLALSAGQIVVGAAIAGTLSTTQMTTDLTESTDDHYIGRIIIWTSGVLAGQATDITDYTGSTKLLTFTATTEAPSATDAFIIV
jgi:hypothetical protein